ncbi:SDR family oxidoreductase [Parasphingorhabdus litoris]|uniref:SDR family oxidoreductase n=1 Tax=Parasphingorhabdus litoris TaxID=394733 RepID=A0ABN1AII3_9SPHN|nr:glucose 1-dehydrogenase [Parasphingorhabdus litoris]
MNRFKAKSVVITGGASGIGAASARRFHAEGAAVVIADLNDELGTALANELGERALFQKTNVAEYDQVEVLMGTAVEAFGRLDVLFNNAGIGCFGLTPDLSVEDWRRVIAIDLDAVFFGCKAAIPYMRAVGGGAIVNTASISGSGADYAFTAYNAAKGGVINYTRALAIDHARENIRVNAISPGPISTAIIAQAKSVPAADQAWCDVVPMGRWGEPEEIAAIAAFLASDDASYMTGSIVTADGGLTAHTGQPNLPAIAARLVADA